MIIIFSSGKLNEKKTSQEQKQKHQRRIAAELDGMYKGACFWPAI